MTDVLLWLYAGGAVLGAAAYGLFTAVWPWRMLSALRDGHERTGRPAWLLFVLLGSDVSGGWPLLLIVSTVDFVRARRRA